MPQHDRVARRDARSDANDHQSTVVVPTYMPMSRVNTQGHAAGQSPAKGRQTVVGRTQGTRGPLPRSYGTASPVRGSGPGPTRTPPPPLVDAQGQNHFVVERLLALRPKPTGDGYSHALVQWLGYPPSANSWEPLETLQEDVPGLVAQALASHGHAR